MVQKNDETLISIITPVYNSQKYIKECLESIIHQSYKNFEIIIIDDGSVDKSKNIIDEYCNLDPRFKYYYQNNEGVSSARNKGVKVAKGDYIFFVDSDDTIEKDYIKKMVEVLKGGDYDLVICAFSYISQNNKFHNCGFESNLYNKYTFWERYYDLDKNSIRINAVTLWGKVFKTNLINEFNFSGVTGEDEHLMYKYIDKVERICLLDEYLYNYRIDNEHSLIHKRDSIIWKKSFDNTINCYDRYKFFKVNKYPKNIINECGSSCINNYLTYRNYKKNINLYFKMVGVSIKMLSIKLSRYNIKLFLNLCFKHSYHLIKKLKK